MKTLFYYCPVCGNIIVKVEDHGPIPHCCGQEMTELHAKTEDSYSEKHLPVLKRIDDCNVCVEIGSVAHPMEPEHHISFIWLETIHGGQLRYLSMGDKLAKEAKAKFCCCKDPIVAVYSYCNVHGLWRYEVQDKECCSLSKCK